MSPIDVTQSAAFLREIIESAPVAMVMVDRHGQIVLVNSETERLFAYSRVDLLGHRVEILIPPRFRGKHPGLRDEFYLEPEARRMASGRELLGLRSDGSEFPVEIGLNPITAGGSLYVLCAIVDITQHRSLESRFRATVESAPAAMVMIDKGGHIVLVNTEAEKLFGYSRSELLGTPIETLVPERFRHAHPTHREGFRHHPVARRMGAGRDLFAIRKDGSEFPVEIGLNPVETPEGLFILSAIVDITERKRNARQLESALAEKTVLLNEIHHRVKNNLQIVAGLLQLQASQANIPVVRDLLAQSESRVQSMAVLHELLYEGRDFSHIRVDRYFHRLAHLLWSGLLAQPAEVQFVADLEPVYLDLNRAIPCGLLVNELLTNALKHSRAETVTLSIRQLPDSNRIGCSVTDDGVGLPAGFDLAATRTLGLTLATQLAEQIGAELLVGNVPAGASFSWEFPLIQETHS